MICVADLLTDEMLSPPAHTCGTKALADNTVGDYADPEPVSFIEQLLCVTLTDGFLLYHLLQFTALFVSLIWRGPNRVWTTYDSLVPKALVLLSSRMT